MGFGWRSFLFEADGAMRRVPLSLLHKLSGGQATLPEYAGQSLRHALVNVEVDGRRRPARINHIDANIWHFDDTGRIHESLMVAAVGARETFEAVHEARKRQEQGSKTGPVVDMSAQFARKAWENRQRWTPGQEEISRIVDSIWRPGPKPGGKRRGGGVRRKRPSLTVVKCAGNGELK